MSHYHKILGLPAGASKGQIKNAYRKLAKEFHPDRSNLPNAKEKFIEIAEAYETLYDGKVEKRRNQQKKNAAQNRTAKEKYWNVYAPPRNEHARAEWERVDTERRRYYKERAKRQAEKRYEQFKKEADAFQKSSFYYPVFWFYNLLQIACVIGTISILILPFMGPYIDPVKYKDAPTETGSIIVIVLILSPIVLVMLNGFKHIKKTIDPYFKDF